MNATIKQANTQMVIRNLKIERTRIMRKPVTALTEKDRKRLAEIQAKLKEMGIK